jgi:BMFP domain-containing protein YqiC
MRQPSLLDKLAEQVTGLVQNGPDRIREDLHEHMKRLLQNMLQDMDLVSREEFDAQVRVLHKTRSRLEALEARVAALEAGLDSAPKS